MKKILAGLLLAAGLGHAQTQPTSSAPSAPSAPLAASTVPATYSPLPAQPRDTPWPDRVWERAPLPQTADSERIIALADELMSEAALERLGRTDVLVVVHRGRIVLERYGPAFACNRITHSMSIAKMLGSVLAAKMVEEGDLILDAPASIARWREDAADPRSRITPEHILRMTNGQQWNELFDFLELAFGDGYADLASYAIERPAAYEPGTHFQYSDGAPGLISYLLRSRSSWGADEVAQYFSQRIFQPLGMLTTEAEFDDHGTWYGSSGVRWSPCDLARFSLMLIRDGIWRDEPFLPPGWVNRMRTPSPASLQPESEMQKVYGAGYGYTSFVYDVEGPSPSRIDAFGHLGFGGHVLRIVPSKDVIVILLGGEALGDPHLSRLASTKAISEAFPDRVSGVALSPAD